MIDAWAAEFPHTFTEWGTCYRSQVPAFLRDSVRYKTHLSEDIAIINPITCMKFDLDIVGDEDYVRLLSTLCFWGVESLPVELKSLILTRELPNEEQNLINFIKEESKIVALYLQYKDLPVKQRLPSAMRLGDISLMQHLHEHEACTWTVKCTTNAIKHGHVDCLQYAIESDCPAPVNACDIAARYGHVDCYLYLRAQGIPQGTNIVAEAVRGSIQQNLPDFTLLMDILHCVLEQSPICSVNAFVEAVKQGHMKSVHFLAQQNYPYNTTVYAAAVENGQLECMQFLHNNGYTCDQYTVFRLCEMFVRLSPHAPRRTEVAECLRECIVYNRPYNWHRVEEIISISRIANPTASAALRDMFGHAPLAERWGGSTLRRNVEGVAMMVLLNALLGMVKGGKVGFHRTNDQLSVFFEV